MDLREIRIGNYFEINTEGQPCPDRLENGIHQWDNWYDYYEFGFNENIFRPIPLTEEWLERFGFDRNELKGRRCYTILYDDRCAFFLYEANGFFYVEQSGVSSNSFKHVHSLQNLYFALTGEELN
jgi:hypothetical protein